MVSNFKAESRGKSVLRGRFANTAKAKNVVMCILLKISCFPIKQY